MLTRGPRALQLVPRERGGQEMDRSGTNASAFANSPAHTGHDFMEECLPRGETVVPVGIYEDGIAAGVDVYQDSLCAVHVYACLRLISPTLAGASSD
eukprot:9033769-Pyramimonas_sp.AAC.2